MTILGREEGVDRDALKRLIRSINRFLGPEEMLRYEAGATGQGFLGFVCNHPLGGAWALNQLGEELGIKEVQVDLLYFDTTSVYFETEEEDEDGLRRRGHSKDHRPDLPQAVIGLPVTRDGLPVRCWVWPGNTADMSVVEQVKKDLIGWKLGRVTIVLDRGFNSEDSLRYL